MTFLAFTGCSADNQKEENHRKNKEVVFYNDGNHPTEIQLSFHDVVINATLDNSKTSQEFLKRLPLTIEMERYDDREYYAAIEELPNQGEMIDDFANGDITYFTTGKSLAIFFAKEDVSNQSNLIRMGHISSDLSVFENLEDRITMTISLKEEKQSTIEKEVIQAYQQRLNAMLNKDTVTLNKILEDDLVLHHISGASQTKDEWIKSIETEEMRYDKITINEITVEAKNNQAIVHHNITIDANIYGTQGNWTLEGDSYCIKKEGQWIWANSFDINHDKT